MALAISLFFLGTLLILLEVFFPSFGVLSVSAAAAFIGGILLAFQESTTAGVAFTVVTLIVVPVVLRAGFKLLPRTAMGKRLVLANPPLQDDEEEPARSPEPLIGKTGVTLTELRPVGSAEIDDTRIDVVTEGEYIEKGCRVRVTRQEGRRVIVEMIEGTQPEARKPRWA